MCLAQKLDIKMVFWTLLVSLIIILITCALHFYYILGLRSQFDSYDAFVQSHMSNHINILIIIYVFVMVLSLTALVTTLFDWYPLLITHAYFLVALSFFMVGVGIYIANISRDIHGENGILHRTAYDLEEVLKHPEWFSFNQTILEPIQRQMHCCGVYSWKDYWRILKRNPWVGNMFPLPKSCCDDQEVVCRPFIKTPRHDGCILKIGPEVTSALNKFGTTLIVFGVSIGIDAGFLFILARKAKEYYYFYPYYM